jgi:hypothetical protein
LTPAGRDDEDAEVIRPSAYAISRNWFHELSAAVQRWWVLPQGVRFSFVLPLICLPASSPT